MNKALKDKAKTAAKKPKSIVKSSKPMLKSFEDKLKELPVDSQEKVHARAKELIAQELTLRDLRQALKLTQEEVAEVLHIKQEAVSRLERRSDLLLSTLGAYIESMGGKLTLTAKFPNRPPVNLTGFEEIDLRDQ